MLSSLQRHPGSRGGEPFRLEVEALRSVPGRLSLRYRIVGPVAELSLPPPGLCERTDELWRHTCLEAFVQSLDGGYYEFNFAPSSQWAAYRFQGYRSGMAAADLAAPRIEGRSAGEGYELAVETDLIGLADLPADQPWRLGLSAVLEDARGGRSYWAIRHPGGKPDFHHPDSFSLELPLTDRP
jgi:hypothetical protein